MTQATAHKWHLLVVDDEEDFCDYVEYVAQKKGFEVASTTDPEQIPNLFSADLNVIVLDLAMPRFDGIEIIRFLSDNRSKASLILMSGFDPNILHSASVIASDNGLHVLGTLSKPFSMERLERLLVKIKVQPVIDTPSEGTDEFPSISDLKLAIDDKQLFVVYQPRINLETGAFVGVQVLARWRHPKQGMIPPSMFIDFAEKHGLIDQLTTLIIESAFKQCSAWKADGLRVQVSINISARTLNNLEFPEQLRTKVMGYGLEPSQIVIEISECSLVDEFAKSLDILTRLRMKGFHLSIGDFGTGFSSMKQLQKIPFNEIKIDQSFIMRSHADHGAKAIVETTIDLGQKLDMTVVAEGIEENVQWDILKEMGCDQAQGYLMASPMLGSELKSWLNGRE